MEGGGVVGLWRGEEGRNGSRTNIDGRADAGVARLRTERHLSKVRGSTGAVGGSLKAGGVAGRDGHEVGLVECQTRGAERNSAGTDGKFRKGPSESLGGCALYQRIAVVNAGSRYASCEIAQHVWCLWRRGGAT